jgi:hypothetical protein
MPDPLINVRELRAFVYCERSWSLDRQGFLVSPETQKDRAAGTVFHERRAVDAVQGDDPRLLRWIYLLLALAAVLLLAYFFQGAHR